MRGSAKVRQWPVATFFFFHIAEAVKDIKKLKLGNKAFGALLNFYGLINNAGSDKLSRDLVHRARLHHFAPFSLKKKKKKNQAGGQ